MNLVYHLKTKHVAKFRDYSKLLEAAKETSSTKGKGTASSSKQLMLGYLLAPEKAEVLLFGKSNFKLCHH